MLQNRTLYFGDNLEILREKIPDESFDLIYLDPPFNSNRNYNVIFKEGLQDSPAQVHAFEDSWSWTEEAKSAFDFLITRTNEKIADLMLAMEKLVGHNDMLAYLTMMTIRLIELHRVLKKTGSIYLHCDPTASHYLKIVMGAIFGKENFRNEIVWKRTNSPKAQSSYWGNQHDTLLFYSKSEKSTFQKVYSKLTEEKRKLFSLNDEKGYFQTVNIVAAGVQKYSGRKEFEFMGVKAAWLYSKENLRRLFDEGMLYRTKSGFRKKMYLNENIGMLISDIWFDDEVKPLQGSSGEALGYQTQKPESLLERIIKASSKEGDWVLDPFCGCGTTVAVAERLNRSWVGIDISMLAINLIRRRLADQYQQKGINVFIDGRPKDIASAKALAEKDRFEFEYWALDLVNAVPAQSKTKENMRGADRGIDGVINFVKDFLNEKKIYGKILVQVKSGSVQRNDIATLKGDIEREKADGGLFITLEEPTKPMLLEVVEAGKLKVNFLNFEFPKIQILTVKDLLDNKKPRLPMPAEVYHKEAKEVKIDETKHQKAFGI